MMKNQWMERALCQAKKAAEAGEVPVGAVLVKDGTVIAENHNRTEESGNILTHAECLVLQEAIEKLGVKRLSGCSLYVTLEPCPMCAGAILLARPDRVYFGAYDGAAGACGGKLDLLAGTGIEVYGGIMETPCAEILKEFFKERR